MLSVLVRLRATWDSASTDLLSIYRLQGAGAWGRRRVTARAILEATGKRLLDQHLKDTGAAPARLVEVGPKTDWDALARQAPWLTTEKLVVKPDQLLKRRGKLGLVGAGLELAAARAWVAERMQKSVQVGRSSGVLRSFLVEPFVAHQQEDAMYVSMYSHRTGDTLLFLPRGGMDVGDVDAKARRLEVPVGQAPPSEEQLLGHLLAEAPDPKKKTIAKFIRELYEVYVDLHFTNLEINPLVVTDKAVHILDVAAKLDGTAEYLCRKKWGHIPFPTPFGRDSTPEEKFVEEMDERTGASLKLTVLNENARVWTMVAGGGASVIYADTIVDLGGPDVLANYGEYSGAPNEQQTYDYARTILKLMTRKPHKDGKILIIGGGIANFTNVAHTFKGIISALKEYQAKLAENKVSIFVRRGGPNYQEGLRKMRALGKDLGVPLHVFGPETHMTAIVGMALGMAPVAPPPTDSTKDDFFSSSGAEVCDRDSQPAKTGKAEDKKESKKEKEKVSADPCADATKTLGKAEKKDMKQVDPCADATKSLEKDDKKDKKVDPCADATKEGRRDKKKEVPGDACADATKPLKKEEKPEEKKKKDEKEKKEDKKEPVKACKEVKKEPKKVKPDQPPSGKQAAAQPKQGAPLFSANTKAIVWGMQTRAIQGMMDFDFVCCRKEPSVACVINPFGGSGKRKFYWGGKEIMIPVFKKLEDAIKNHPDADVMVNFTSFRSAYDSTIETMKYPQIRTIAIIAEGIPENLTRRLIVEAERRGVAIVGPATVGGVRAGCFKIGNTGGMMDNILQAKLYRKGSVGYVSRSGGLSNELNNLISKTTNGVLEGVAIGGDRYPVTTFLFHLLRLHADPEVKMLVLLGEVGGEDEYEVCKAIQDGRIQKPLIAWCIGTCAKMFTSDVQFGHAGAFAASDRETATAKNEALRACGAHVPASFDALGAALREVYETLVQGGIIVPAPEVRPPHVPLDFDWAKTLGLVRKPASFTTSICDERGQELQYAGLPIGEVLKRDVGLGGVVSLLWFQRLLPAYALRYIEMCLMLTADHGPAVSGAHNTIVCARAGKDLVSSLASGLLTIGSRFGGALDESAKMFSKAFDAKQEPQEFVSSMRKEGKLIMGVGHRIKSINNPDLRVTAVKEFVQKHFPQFPLLKFALEVEKITTAKRPNLILNVDGVIATSFVDLLRHSGCFDKKEAKDYINMGSINSLFVLGRTIGFIGHYMDQKRLKQGLYRHPWDDISYMVPKLRKCD